MKITLKIMSGLVALALVLAAVAWTVPMGSISGPSTGPAVRSAGGAAVTENAGEPALPEGQVYVSAPSGPTISPAVRELPPLDDTDYPLFDREMARKDDFGFTGPDVQGFPWLDPLAELQDGIPAAGINDFATPLTNWAGMDYNSFPPDTTGDVGPNHLVQAVNGSGGSTVRVFDKSGTVLATFAMESLASSAPCNSGYCDPIVIYDSLADRWFISEFSSNSSYPMCLYVSTTPDPTGSWYAYTFDLPYYDYPKYAVWPDAYYMGYNGGTTGARQVFAFDRASMLAGLPATYQMFSVPSLPGFGFQLVVPASLEGPTPPPAGAPGLFMRPRDTEVHDDPNNYPSADLMEMWAFHVDWNTPANSTVTKLPDVPMAEYDSTLCGTGSIWACMPQPGTTQKLDPIREPLHQPLQYRNWGTYETLVGGFVNDVDGTDHASVRWFEMRTVDGVWAMYQQGTIGGDEHHRSVTSVALDGAGGMGLGYTLTSSSIYPSIRYAGRRPWDPLNTMTYVDAVAQAGDSSQTSYDRWGDYSGIGVDPADDCTFWYTTEYMSGGSSATRVVSFRLDPDFVVAPSPTVVDMCGATGDAIYGVSLAKTCALDGTVTMSTGGVPSGASATWSANPVAPPGSTTLTLGNLGSVASGTYNIDIIGTATGPIIRQETVVLNLQTTAPEAVTLLSPADRATGVAGDTDLTWAAAARASNYDVQVAIDPGFTNVVRSVAGLAATSYTPSPSLDPGTVYYWRVRGNNACGSSDYSVTRTFSTSPVTCQSYAGAVGTITRNGTTAFNLTVPPGDVGAITDVDVIDLVGTHSTSVSDLAFALDSPNGAPIELIPSMCTGTVFNKSLDDEASDVLACPLDDGATQQPATSLSDFDGQSSTGTWVLSISNASRNRNGSLTGWSLDICKTLAPMGVDFSDLATSYGIAWHNGISTLRLGNTWTDDATFQTGDDNDDGVSFPTPLIAGQNSTIRVNVQGVPTNGRWLRVWIDWNNDGVFEDTTGPGGEYVHDGAAVDGDNNLTIAIPADYGQPVNYRARLYDSASAPSGVLAQDTGSYGGATGGEVEDDPTPAPTAVFLVRFEAATTGGAVHIEWETVSEIDHLGFHLYRSDPSSRVTLKLNEALIASQAPGTPSGAIYTWTDLEVEPGVTYSYELEDVDIHGTVTRHGPVEVTAAYSVYLPVMFK